MFMQLKVVQMTCDKRFHVSHRLACREPVPYPLPFDPLTNEAKSNYQASIDSTTGLCRVASSFCIFATVLAKRQKPSQTTRVLKSWVEFTRWILSHAESGVLPSQFSLQRGTICQLAAENPLNL